LSKTFLRFGSEKLQLTKNRLLERLSLAIFTGLLLPLFCQVAFGVDLADNADKLTTF
jgi:hypothetical protein